MSISSIFFLMEKADKITLISQNCVSIKINYVSTENQTSRTLHNICLHSYTFASELFVAFHVFELDLKSEIVLKSCYSLPLRNFKI